jgi:hypothetical protein
MYSCLVASWRKILWPKNNMVKNYLELQPHFFLNKLLYKLPDYFDELPDYFDGLEGKQSGSKAMKSILN